MTREEALKYCANPDNCVFYSPELGIVFIWLTYLDSDSEAAGVLSASICLVPESLWAPKTEPDLNTLIAALLRGDIHAKTY